MNFLNSLGERDKMRGLPRILSLSHNEVNKFNNTRARMLALSRNEVNKFNNTRARMLDSS